MRLPQHFSKRAGTIRERGFTMVEIAICLGVIAFALVAIIGILPIGLSVQKDNREQTIINFDAHYLMDAIRSGTLGQDDLTNYVISITTTSQAYQIKNGVTNAVGPFTNNVYNTFTNAANGNYYFLNGAGHPEQYLTNGASIIGLLTIPKYILQIPDGSLFVSNSVTADFRALTGSPMDQGNSQTSRDFAFTYRVFPEIVPFSIPDPSLTNFTTGGLFTTDISKLTDADKASRSNAWQLANNLGGNLSEVRLRFRWPILPSGQPGPGNQVYRTIVSGQTRATNSTVNQPNYYFQSQNFKNASIIPTP